MEKHHHSKLVKGSLIVGIVIVLNMFFSYALSLVYPEPKYEDWIPSAQINEPISSQRECVAVGGQWNGASKGENGPDGYCDPDFTKRNTYEHLRDLYNRNVFIVLSLVGIGVLIVGIFLANAVLAAALTWGGVLSLCIASVRYWSAADTFVKVLILAIALGALMWVALKKFGK